MGSPIKAIKENVKYPRDLPRLKVLGFGLGRLGSGFWVLGFRLVLVFGFRA